MSRVTIVDCDDQGVVEPMLELCGDTPLRVRTPSGGQHLWYRSSGERNENLRSCGLPVDIRGDGGFVVVPPSVRPSGVLEGRGYELFEGSWRDLARLPPLRARSLKDVRARPVPHGNCIQLGSRNKELFSFLRKQAPACEDYETLLDVGRTFGTLQCDPELPEAEIRKAVGSVWRMHAEGRLWASDGRQRVYFTDQEFGLLSGDERGADALMLLFRLKLAHWNRATFAAVPDAMASAQVLPGWAHGRYRNALRTLVTLGLLEVTRAGGRGAGDPRQYRFAPLPPGSLQILETM
jgi:hypothetical protein